MTSRRLLRIGLVGVIGGFVLTTAIVIIGQYWDLADLGIAVADFALESRWKRVPVLRLSDEQWNSLATTVVATYLATDFPAFDDRDQLVVVMPYNWPTEFPPGEELHGLRIVTWDEIDAIAERDGRCPYVRIDWRTWSFTQARLQASYSVDYPREVRAEGKITLIPHYGGDRHDRLLECAPSWGDWECEVVEETDT